MTTEKKIAANRLNAKKSTGPRTSRGKSRASGNARRHGWAVVKTVPSMVSADVQRMAKAICGGNATSALYEQAVIIAESEIVLLNLRAARVAAINRNRIVGRKLERPNQEPDFNEELTLALESLAGGELRPAIKLLKRTTRALRVAVARVTKANAKIGAKASERADRGQTSRPPASSPDLSTKRSDEDQQCLPTRPARSRQSGAL
jgi:hypothetical protein